MPSNLNYNIEEMIKFFKEERAKLDQNIERLESQKKNDVLENSEKTSMFGHAFEQEDAIYFLGLWGELLEVNSLEEGYNDSLLTTLDLSFCKGVMVSQGNCFSSSLAAKIESHKRRLRQLARVHMEQSWRGLSLNEGDLRYTMDSNSYIHTSRKTELLQFSQKDHLEAFFDEVGHEGIRMMFEL